MVNAGSLLNWHIDFFNLFLTCNVFIFAAQSKRIQKCQRTESCQSNGNTYFNTLTV